MFYSFVQKICAAFFAKFGIHMAVFSGGIVGRCFPLCTLTILYQQRGSHRRLFGFDVHEYFRFSSSYLRSCIFSSRVRICSTVSCDSETDRETVSPLTINFRSSVREQPRGSIALIKASKMQQTLGSTVSDTVSARNGTASFFCSQFDIPG